MEVRVYVVRGDVTKLGDVLSFTPREKGLQRPTIEPQGAWLKALSLTTEAE